jgi:calcineurin-like phosphoesterase family protein
MIYFISDPHFFHSNIIKYCKRPFNSASHMNEALIANWNKRVQPDDHIYCLGDFGFGDRDELQGVIDRLQGRKHLILGNHDKDVRKTQGWEWIREYHELTIDGDFFILFHYAPRVWNKSHHGSIALFGHSHGTMPGNSQSLDVGVDCWDYAPVSVSQIKGRLATLPVYTGYRDQAGGSDYHAPRDKKGS